MSSTSLSAEPSSDPYRFLEDVDAAASMDWVRAQNAISLKELQADPGYAPLYDRLLAIYDSKERIPALGKVGAWYYNFWRDAANVRGIMRRTTLDEYRKPDPAWETVVDVDALSASENENWVWKGWSCRYPDYRRCIVYLSRGGGDATVAREFDLEKMAFIAPEAGGFYLPEAKGNLSWIDADHVYVRTDFGPGTMTDSGYPRIVKRWTRGTTFASAEEVFAGQQPDISVEARQRHLHIGDRVVYRTLLRRGVTFFSNETFYRAEDGKLVKLDLPADAEASLWRDQLLVTLRGAWKRAGNANADANAQANADVDAAAREYPAGALLAIDFDRFMAGARDFKKLYEPGPRKSLGQSVGTLNTLLVNEMSEVQNHVFEWSLNDGRWTRRAVDLPRDGTIAMQPVDDDESDDYFVYLSNALQPTTLALARAGSDQREPLKQLPAFFDATGLNVVQHEVRSADGTRIPYIEVTPKGYRQHGRAPTILYGYGGFEIPMLPRAYSAGNGAAWLERGGVFVVAGIRGGGEFGPDWHDAAIKVRKQNSYDDFIAVAEDLIARKVTSPAHLGIMGGSNGGLLVGAVALQRPELFKAVVCQVPLLDMRRYNQLLAGASWMGEYGNPDVPAEWEYISKYSPYQNVVKGRRYPRFLFTTSTRDDRVHPGHARKMAAKMNDQKHDLLYFENTEGGHAGAANNTQQARMNALEYTFMARELR